MNTGIQRGVASVEVAAAILRAIRSASHPLTLRELAGLTGLSASRLHHYLVSLARVGLVRKTPLNQYGLGNFTLELGLVAADNLAAQHTSAGWLHRLSDQTGESSFFAVPSPQGPLIVRWEQGARPLTVHARLGTVMPILTSATGLTWLAFETDASLAVFERELRRLPPTQRSAIRQARESDAAGVRRAGHATAHGTMISNVNAVAAPVFSRSGALAGILTVLGLGGYFDTEEQDKASTLVKRFAEEFGAGLS